MRLLALGASLAVWPFAVNAADCAVEWRALDRLLSGAGIIDSAPDRPVRASGEDACTISDLTMLPDEPVSYRVRSFTWSAEGLDRFIAQGVPPTSISLQLGGVRAVARAPQPATEWILGRPGAGGPSDLRITALWSPSGRLLIETDEPGRLGRPSVWADAAIDGVDLSSAATAKESAASFRITSLKADVALDEAFARFLLTGLGAGRFEESDDPETEFDDFRREATKTIDALPDASFPVHSRVAMKALLADLPDPEGRLKVEITSQQGFGPANLLPLLLRRSDGGTGLAAALSGVRADLQYLR